MLFTLNDRHDVHYLFRPWLETDAKALYNNYCCPLKLRHSRMRICMDM